MKKGWWGRESEIPLRVIKSLLLIAPFLEDVELKFQTAKSLYGIFSFSLPLGGLWKTEEKEGGRKTNTGLQIC